MIIHHINSPSLNKIIEQKKKEVGILRQQLADDPFHPINNVLQGNYAKLDRADFKAALLGPTLAVIAEIKRRSPSKGALADIVDPIALAREYAQGNASAISILTDEEFFSGSLADLKAVVLAMENQTIPRVPVLRKDFIIDKLQIAQAVDAGADAILLIVAALGSNTKELLEYTQELGIQALVEIHDEPELDVALNCGATIIGINNRNLLNFVIDTTHALHLIEKIPHDIVKVAESGILDPQLAHDYHAAGFNAILVGEALVKAKDPKEFIAACRR